MKISTVFCYTTAAFAQILFTVAAQDDANAALLRACMSGRGHDNVDDVKAALAQGADINAKDERSGQTALMASVLRGKINIVKHLLTSGADPSIPEASGYTPPHGAAFQGRADVMELLIEAGLDVNSPHDDGFVPLHRACWGDEERHAQTLRVLLKHGVPYDIKNTNDGSTCQQMAAGIKILKVLEEETGKKFIEEGDEEFFAQDDDDDDDDDDYVPVGDIKDDDDDDDDYGEIDIDDDDNYDESRANRRKDEL